MVVTGFFDNFFNGLWLGLWLVCRLVYRLVFAGIMVVLGSRWLVCGSGVDERVVVVWRCGRQNDREIEIRNKW